MKTSFKIIFVFLFSLLLLSARSVTAFAEGHANKAETYNNSYSVAEYYQNPVKIKKSLRMLYRVRYILINAANNFGGHKVLAIRNINKAIFQLKMALRYLRYHQ